MVDDGINTSNNNNNNNNPEGEDREINLYAVFFKYMVYWPWFVASVLACCIGMYVFLRYQTPVYNVTSSVLIKEDDKKGANAASGLAAIQDLGMLSMTSNFDNEVEILRSRTLIKKVVNDMGLYIDMEESNALGFNPPLYKNSPVNVFITPEEADRLADTVYGGRAVCAAAAHGSVVGCQFHPEKSGPVGLTIIKNFAQLTEAKA